MDHATGPHYLLLNVLLAVSLCCHAYKVETKYIQEVLQNLQNYKFISKTFRLSETFSLIWTHV